MNRLFSRAVVWGLLFSGPLLGATVPPAPQPLPNPQNFVANLDVRCYRINRPIQLTLDHLNPLFVAKGLPREFVDLDPHQLCVPVQKNTEVPPPDTLPFLRYVDWRCYGINGPSLDLPLQVNHLNPVIAEMFGPTDLITVREPQQLCVPVAKTDPTTGQSAFPPPDILRLIQWLDVKCYRIDSNRHLGGEPIQLTHLNPLLAGLPPEMTFFVGPAPFQLCVPVAKNGQFPPSDVLPIIQNSDVLCYKLRGQPLNRQLTLTHLNPVLSTQPAETVLVTDTQKLCVPVSKQDPPPPPPAGQ
ncbi:MAG TPA: hypothetical protein VF173_32060 [Thermoanaerobaculia bacterium]|nr:hypothetical protein [Thermoanaerobaculia bacterium]